MPRICRAVRLAVVSRSTGEVRHRVCLMYELLTLNLALQRRMGELYRKDRSDCFTHDYQIGYNCFRVRLTTEDY